MAYTALTIYGQKPKAQIFEGASAACIHVHMDANTYVALEADEAQALGLELLRLAATVAAKPAPTIVPPDPPELSDAA